MPSISVTDFVQGKGVTVQSWAVALTVPMQTTTVALNGVNTVSVSTKAVNNSLKAVIKN
jgi:hypothetical protein